MKELDLSAGGFPESTYVGKDTTVADVSAEIARLARELEEAPHDKSCSFNICPVCDDYKRAPAHDDVHIKTATHHAFQNGKCNCWKSRTPRAGG